jgi:acyl carrier protein
MELQDFISSFADQFDETDYSQITETTKFLELEEWSSLTALVIIAFVMTKYGKNITGAEIRSCTTVKDLFNLVVLK